MRDKGAAIIVGVFLFLLGLGISTIGTGPTDGLSAVLILIGLLLIFIPVYVWIKGLEQGAEERPSPATEFVTRPPRRSPEEANAILAELLSAKTGYDFQRLIVEVLGGEIADRLTRDGGIDGFLDGMPVQVKRGRATRRDVETFRSAIERVGSETGLIVANHFMPEAESEAGRLEQLNVRIRLLTVADLVRDGP